MRLSLTNSCAGTTDIPREQRAAPESGSSLDAPSWAMCSAIHRVSQVISFRRGHLETATEKKQHHCTPRKIHPFYPKGQRLAGFSSVASFPVWSSLCRCRGQVTELHPNQSGHLLPKVLPNSRTAAPASVPPQTRPEMPCGAHSPSP